MSSLVKIIADPDQDEIIDVVRGMMQSLVAAVLVKKQPRLVLFDPPKSINNVIQIDSYEDEVYMCNRLTECDSNVHHL